MSSKATIDHDTIRKWVEKYGENELAFLYQDGDSRCNKVVHRETVKDQLDS